MKLIFAFGLLNSLGTVVMWLMLGPYYSQMADGLLSMGVIGMIRQLAFIMGATLAGSWADEGRPLNKSIWLEVLQCVLGLIFLLPLVAFPESIHPIVFPIWSCLRFGLSGAAFVLGFKIMSFETVSLGSGAILHLLTTQGAVLFGSVIAIGLPSVSSKPFHLALMLDCLTSCTYVAVLLQFRRSSFDRLLPKTTTTVFGRLMQAAGSFWTPRLFPYNWIQLSALVGLSGFAITSFHFSQSQTMFHSRFVYPGCSFIYGLCLWIGGISIQRGLNPHFAAMGGAVLLIGSAALLPFVTGDNGLLLLQFLLYVASFSALLHGTNTLLLANVPPDKAGTVRAGMLLVLSVIFAAGEGGISLALQERFGPELIAAIRLLSGFLVLVALLLLLSRRRIFPRFAGRTTP